MTTRRIIVADGVESNRAVLHAILQENYEVLEATDGEQTLSLIRENANEAEALLLDLDIPGMGGYRVIEEIRRDAALGRVPILVTTDYIEGDAEERAIALGADDYVARPYNAEVIRWRLANVIELRESSSTIDILQRDRLTGLYNRDTFFERAAELIASHEPGYFTMSCFDINNFKVINDQLGTQTGDEVLRHVASCVRRWTDGREGVCSRIAADTYAVLHDTTLLDSPALAQTQYESTHPPCLDHPISIRIGRYTIDDLDMTVSAMYDRAALAAKSVKGRADTRIAYYDESMREHILREQEVLDTMEPAIASGQFEVWFQPQYNHATGARVGAEALVRWRHPVRGLIAPDEFIPVLERTGLIYKLDSYVWRRTCEYLRAWTDGGLMPLPVSVNVSRYDLLQPDIISRITSLIDTYALDKDMLRLEITESAFTDSGDAIINAVNRLIAAGFTIEIDDFGSGYSSLNTLKDVPAQIIKLDMKFLESGNDSQRGGNIVESIVRMAKWLAMPVIAEGVETKEQADFLKSIGCFYIQGYFYARPMPAHEYEALAKQDEKERDMVALETVENLDNNSFWDPESMDTLIFNSFVGGACIFEYRKGSIELMRATDKYAQVIGSAGMTVEDALKLDWSNHLDEKNAQAVIEALEKSIETGDEVTTEYEFMGLPGCPPTTYLRSTLRVIARADDRYLVYCTNENITEHKLAEQELELARQKADELSQQMADLMNDTPGGFARLQVIRRGLVQLVYANDGYCRLRGTTRDELTETHPRDAFVYVHSDDIPYVQKSMDEALANLDTRTLKCRLRGSDGSYKWVKLFVRASKSEAGINYLNLYYTDLSARESALQQAIPLMLDAIMDSSSDLSFAKDKDFVYLRCSRAFAEMAGLGSQKDVIGKTDYDLFERETADKYRHDDERLFEEGMSLIDMVESIPSEDGIPHYSVTSKYLLKDTDGEIIGLYGTGRDITGHREAYSQLKLLTETIPGGLATYTLSNDGTRLTYFNDGYCALFGYAHEEYVKLAQHDVISRVYAEDRPGLEERINTLFREDVPIRHTYRVHHRDGSCRWIALSAAPSDRKDDLLVAHAVLIDVTEQKKAEQEAFEQRRNLLENLPCGAAIYEVEGDVIRASFINKRYMELVGRDIPVDGTAPIVNSIHPDDRLLLATEVKLAMQENRDVESVVRVKHGTGGYVTFRVTGRMRERVGDTTVFYAIYVPLDQSHAPYHELLPVALSAMMESSRDIVYVKDRDLVYICGSRAFADICGMETVAEIAGKTDHDLLDARFAEEFIAGDKEILETGRPLADSLVGIPLQDGTTRFVRTSKYPLRDASENIVGIYGIGRDVTEEQQESDQLKLLMNNIPCGIASYELQPGSLQLVLCNDGYIDLTGYTREEYAELSKADPLCLVYEQDKHVIYESFNTMLEEYRPLSYTYRIRAKDGSCRWFNTKVEPVERRTDSIVVNVVKFDVSELMRAEEALRQSEKMLRMVVGHSNRVIYRYDLETKEAFSVAPEAALAAGFPEYVKSMPESLIRDGIIVAEDAEYVRELFATAHTRRQGDSMRFRGRTKDGSVIWLDVDYTFVKDEAGKPVAAVVSCTDITKLHDKEQLSDDMRKLAETDGMTGYYNKTTVETRVNKYLSGSSGIRCALLACDLDNFKLINDTLGHDQGDRAIRMITHVLQSQFRQTDIAGRVGGDEFVIFLENCGDETWLEKTMNSLMNRLQALHVGPEDELPLRCSIGIAFGASGVDTYDSLFSKADRALYHVKRNGKDDFAFYVPQMQDSFFAYKSRLVKQAEAGVLSVTMREACSLTQEMKLVFEIVRLLDVETMEAFTFDSYGNLGKEPDVCHAVWGRNSRCENCISRTAYDKKGVAAKDEVVDGKLFHCISKYIEVDGQAYVLELVSAGVE